MSKVCRLWYRVEQPWGTERGFGKKLVGIYTSKQLMLQHIDACIQNLINQIDTNDYEYNVVKDNTGTMLRVVKQYDLWDAPKTTYFHCFSWDGVELDTIEVESIKLSSYIE